MTDVIPAGRTADRVISDPAVVARDDPRYAELAGRGANPRASWSPDAFTVVSSTAEVVAAVESAVRDGRRIAIRSGGHCYENLSDGDDVTTVIDLAEMNAVSFDADRGAFAVEPGAVLLDVYRKLYLRWGVTVPGGASAGVAFGGHVQGGGYGSLCRQLGLSVDYLYGVEVVVVDADGRARAVVATREPDDPNRELWWAHTGGGGGTFGVVTRYWFRDLPTPPAAILTNTVMFPRGAMDRDAFRTLVTNHGRWHERHGSPADPYRALFSGLILLGQQPNATAEEPGLAAILFTHYDATQPHAQQRVSEYVAEVTNGVAAPHFPLPEETLPWLASTRLLAELQDETNRQKVKSEYRRRRFTDAQMDTLFTYLSGSDPNNTNASVSIQSYGGLSNALDPQATAVPQRDSVMRVLYLKSWEDSEQDQAQIDWLRRLYRDVHCGTGGVPTTGGDTDGCFINFLDVDMADPAWNTSSEAWHELYFKSSYARLQAVKSAYDPRNVFRHRLSVRPA